MSSSKDAGGPAAAAAAAAKPRTTTAYSRFIPREELRGVALSNWQPGSFGAVQSPLAALRRAREAEPDAAAAASDARREADVQAQVQAARQGGYEDGYRDGLVALENFKQSFARQMTAQIGALVSAFDAEFEAMEQQLATSVTRVAVQLARQVVRSELAARPELVARVAQEAIGAVLTSAREVVVHVHPQDLPLVAQGAADAIAARGARLVAQPSLERGGCHIETEVGTVDARIDARWDQATQAFAADLPWESQ